MRGTSTATASAALWSSALITRSISSVGSLSMYVDRGFACSVTSAARSMQSIVRLVSPSTPRLFHGNGFPGGLFHGHKVGIRYRGNLRDTAGNPAHAATSIGQRFILLDPSLKARPREHRRILLHEYFHFAWVRLGNQR